MQEIPQNSAPQAPKTATTVNTVRKSVSPMMWKPQPNTTPSEAQKRQEKILKKSGSNTLTLGIIAVVLVGGVALAFFVLSFLKQGTVDTLQKEVGEIKTDINKLKKEKNVVIANIIDKNKIGGSLPLRKIISDFEAAARKSHVQLQGFNVQNGVITTNLIAKEGSKEHTDPAVMIIEMMRHYKKDNTSNFDLEPITNISGDPDQRTTSISFKIIEKKNTKKPAKK